jgi:hypothetical protein
MKLGVEEHSIIETDTNSVDLDSFKIKNSKKINSIDNYTDLKIEKDDLVTNTDFPKLKNLNNNKSKKYGNTFVFYFNKSGEPLIVIGPHCKIIIYIFFNIRAFLPMLIFYCQFHYFCFLLFFLELLGSLL